jgi:CheY-like chemotaxis protein
MRAAESAACGEADEKMHLLVVDDDEVDRIAIIRALRQWHCPLAIVEAATRRRPVRFAAQPFDAVLLDIACPNGRLEVLRRMYSRRMFDRDPDLTGMDRRSRHQCIGRAPDFCEAEISPRG